MNETIRDIVNELMDRCRIEGGQREAYEERIARAVWRDRAEVVEIVRRGDEE